MLDGKNWWSGSNVNYEYKTMESNIDSLLESAWEKITSGEEITIIEFKQIVKEVIDNLISTNKE